jgi:alpha-tubulin suppressor-like RCC1 family protein
MDRACAIVTKPGKVITFALGPLGQPSLVEPFVSDVRSVSVGSLFKCALLKSGKIACSGFNDQGQLGSGDLASSKMFGLSNSEMRDLTVRSWSTVEGISSAISVAAGHNHVCAVVKDGRVFCWGGNENQELGSGPLPFTTKPVPVVGLQIHQTTPPR